MKKRQSPAKRLSNAALKSDHSPLRVAFIGWGAIAQAAAALLDPDAIEVVAVAVRDAAVKREGIPGTAKLIAEPGELAALKPNIVAEAAGRETVSPWGSAAISAGADFIVSSVSAFADEATLEALRQQAQEHGQQLIIQPGALAGVEALAAAKLMGVDAVEHLMVKPPKAWLGTPAETLCQLDSLTEPTAFFSANAAETASQFPKNANVAMTTALAGIGPAATTITLVADPTATTNRHELRAHGLFGTLEVVIANNPLPANPKTSALAALSLARCINNRASALVI